MAEERTVRFHGRVQFKTIRHIKDFSEDEVLDSYYRKSDYARMSDEVSKIAELVAGNESAAAKVCTRGLEHLIEEEIADYRAEKMIESVDAVLDEQDDQRDEEIYDDEAIASVYAAIATPLLKDAYSIGLRDELEAQQAYAEMDDMDWSAYTSQKLALEAESSDVSEASASSASGDESPIEPMERPAPLPSPEASVDSSEASDAMEEEGEPMEEDDVSAASSVDVDMSDDDEMEGGPSSDDEAEKLAEEERRKREQEEAEARRRAEEEKERQKIEKEQRKIAEEKRKQEERRLAEEKRRKEKEAEETNGKKVPKLSKAKAKPATKTLTKKPERSISAQQEVEESESHQQESYMDLKFDPDDDIEDGDENQAKSSSGRAGDLIVLPNKSAAYLLAQKRVKSAKSRKQPRKPRNRDRKQGESSEFSPFVRRLDGTFAFRNDDKELQKMKQKEERKGKVLDSLFAFIDGEDDLPPPKPRTTKKPVKKFGPMSARRKR